MLPEPLHPAVVHFPIVLAILLPISAIVAVWAIHRGVRPLHAWAIPLALALATTGSAWVALETGEDQEEAVEEIVGEEALHAHEEAAERFLVLAAVLTLVAGVGLSGATVGRAARLLTTAGSVVLLAAGVQVGDAGGKLVYEHGAAAAYVGTAGGERPAGAAVPERGAGEEEGDEH